MAAAGTIERVQDKLDKLLLETFEVVRGHGDTSETAAQKAAKLVAAYDDAVTSVDDLLGIDRSQEEQEAYLAKATAEYEELRKEVIALDTSLRAVAAQVDNELEQVRWFGCAMSGRTFHAVPHVCVIAAVRFHFFSPCPLQLLTDASLGLRPSQS